MKRAAGVLCFVALASIALPDAASPQASDRCPDEEWSEWYPAADGLHFNYKVCWRGTLQEFEWNWSNFSNAGVSLAYRIFSRDADNCAAPEHEAIGSGHLTVPPHTRLDIPGGGSAGPGRYGRVYLCISRDWQVAIQRALDSLEVGTRIRVSKTSDPAERVLGSVNSITPNAVRIAVTSPDAHSAESVQLVRFDEMSELEISRGVQARATTGMAAGGLVGAIGGAIIGAVTAGYECEIASVYDEQIRLYAPTRVCTGPLPGERAAIVGLVAGVVGGAVGYVIGSTFPSERWASTGPTWTLVRF